MRWTPDIPLFVECSSYLYAGAGLFNGAVLNYFMEMETKRSKEQGTGSAQAGPRDILAELVCTNTALRLASRRLGQLYDDELAPTGLKATQVGLLSKIAIVHDAAKTEWPTLQTLAESLAVSLSALTYALRPLVRDGLVELLPDPDDGRTKRGALTDLGEAKLSEALVLWQDANQRVEDVLGTSAAALRSLADDVASAGFLDAYTQRRKFDRRDNT
jgi:DNA-binding MarR family transcriptional regulator